VLRDRPPAHLPSLYASLAGKASVHFDQLGGSVEDPGRLAPAGRYSLSENPYGARGPNGVFFQGSIELFGAVLGVSRWNSLPSGNVYEDL
jgi:hypothetical protein